MATLDGLKQLVPPPARRVDPPGDWIAIETDLGTSLPEDYKRFIEIYGSGAIVDQGFDREQNVGTGLDILVYNPFSLIPGWNLVRQTRSTRKFIGEGYREMREFYPYPPWPAEGGVFCWGHTINGDSLYWRTIGSPDNWTVVVKHGAAVRMMDFDFRMVDFIVAVLTGKLKQHPFDVRFEKIGFEPNPWCDPK
jgi:hypothetical protein